MQMRCYNCKTSHAFAACLIHCIQDLRSLAVDGRAWEVN